MPWSGSSGSQSFTRDNGTHTGTQVWQEDAAEPVDILASRHDTHDQDVATGINACLKHDGGNTASADIPMGGNTLTNIAAAGARTEPARFSDVQDNKGEYVATVAGTADAITITPSIPITAYAAGQRFSFIAGSTNTTAVTINVSAVGAKDIKRPIASLPALEAGDIVASTLVVIEYDGTRFQLLSWKSQADIVLDTSPQLGADLDANGFDIKFDAIGSDGIFDGDGNPLLTFVKAASAENRLHVSNAAPGSAVEVSVAGSDTDITLQLNGKNAGGVRAFFHNTGLRIGDSNNSHHLIITQESNQTADRTLALNTGDASRTFTLSGDVTFSGNATIPSGFGSAGQAEQEGASSLVAFVSSGVQHYHPSAAKAWVRFNSAGTVAASYNITSVTDTGVGDWTVNIDTDFSSANYCGVVSGGCDLADPTGTLFSIGGTPAAGTFQIRGFSAFDTLNDPGNPDAIFAAFYGDQA